MFNMIYDLYESLCNNNLLITDYSLICAMEEIRRRYGGGMEEIWRRYRGDIEEISRRYRGDIEEIYTRYRGDIEER